MGQPFPKLGDEHSKLNEYRTLAMQNTKEKLNEYCMMTMQNTREKPNAYCMLTMQNTREKLIEWIMGRNLAQNLKRRNVIPSKQGGQRARKIHIEKQTSRKALT